MESIRIYTRFSSSNNCLYFLLNSIYDFHKQYSSDFIYIYYESDISEKVHLRNNNISLKNTTGMNTTGMNTTGTNIYTSLNLNQNHNNIMEFSSYFSFSKNLDKIKEYLNIVKEAESSPYINIIVNSDILVDDTDEENYKKNYNKVQKILDTLKDYKFVNFFVVFRENCLNNKLKYPYHSIMSKAFSDKMYYNCNMSGCNMSGCIPKYNISNDVEKIYENMEEILYLVTQ